MRRYETARTLLERPVQTRPKPYPVPGQATVRNKAAEYTLFQNYFILWEQQLLQLESELQDLKQRRRGCKEIPYAARDRAQRCLKITDEKDRAAFRKAQAKQENSSA